MINHCVDPVSKNQFEFWYKYAVLENITGIKAMKLNAENLCTALDYFYPDGKDKAVEIEKEIVGKLKELFGIKTDCLFYDIKRKSGKEKEILRGFTRMPRNLCCAIWPVLLKEGGQLYAPL